MLQSNDMGGLLGWTNWDRSINKNGPPMYFKSIIIFYNYLEISWNNSGLLSNLNLNLERFLWSIYRGRQELIPCDGRSSELNLHFSVYYSSTLAAFGLSSKMIICDVVVIKTIFKSEYQKTFHAILPERVCEVFPTATDSESESRLRSPESTFLSNSGLRKKFKNAQHCKKRCLFSRK